MHSYIDIICLNLSILFSVRYFSQYTFLLKCMVILSEDILLTTLLPWIRYFVLFFFPPCNTNNLSGIPMYVSQKVLLLSLFSSKITQFCTYRTCLICKKSLVFERFFLSDLIQGCTVPMLMLTLMHYTVNTNTSCWFEDGKRLFMQTALASYNAQTKQWKINELNLKAWTTPTTQTLKCKTMEKEKTNKTNNN